jgi:hypothetical protein
MKIDLDLNTIDAELQEYAQKEFDNLSDFDRKEMFHNNIINWIRTKLYSDIKHRHESNIEYSGSKDITYLELERLKKLKK